jgi:hypothetical protein
LTEYFFRNRYHDGKIVDFSEKKISVSDYLILVCKLGEGDESLGGSEETLSFVDKLSTSTALKGFLCVSANSRLRCLIGMVTEISPNFSIKLNVLA